MVVVVVVVVAVVGGEAPHFLTRFSKASRASTESAKAEMGCLTMGLGWQEWGVEVIVPRKILKQRH